MGKIFRGSELVVLLVLLSIPVSMSHVTTDESDDVTVFTAINVSPEDLEYLPSVGNGHVATVVYSDTVFMNGLYNGKTGSSHRAKIPSGNNIRVQFLPREITSPDGTVVQAIEEWVVRQHNLTLDVARAVFIENWDLSWSPQEGQSHQGVGVVRVEQKTWAHRHFATLMVTQIQVSGSGSDVNNELELILQLSSDPDPGVSEDLKEVNSGEYKETPLNQVGFWCAEICEAEDEQYRDKILSTVCTIRSYVPPKVTVTWNNGRPSTTTMTFISGYGTRIEEIQGDFNVVADMILTGSHEEILALHVASWQKEFWWGDRQQPVIQVEGNQPLSKVINGCLYYILSNLPSSSYIANKSASYGLSPSGLPYGSKGTNYQGHTFWDTETWLFPPILYFYPNQAQRLLNYRLSRVQAAWDRAKVTGYKGARFPWESASTGDEVSPEGFGAGAKWQVHITSDVSFAIRQYISMTRDIDWLKERQTDYPTNGCGLVRDMAEFWTTRATLNTSTGYHDIKNVMSPDEDHNHGDNNGFTNVGAGYSIFYAKYAHCLCGNEGNPIPEAWLDIAKNLALTYDVERDYHPEYEGYQYGTAIKQADVILMGYPLLYEMSLDTRRNDIEAYTAVSRENGPAMTWSMHTIAFLEVDDVIHADKMFNQSYQWHRKEPFHLWMEWLPERVPLSKFQPAVNFITGMGGFLQSLLSGYGGLRIYPEKLVLRRPRLPPGSTGLVFRSVSYLGNTLDIKVSDSQVKLWIRQPSSRYPLQVAKSGGETVAFVRGSLVINLTDGSQFPVEISTKTSTNCALPVDKIGIANNSNVRKEDEVKWWKKLKPTRRHRIGHNSDEHQDRKRIRPSIDKNGCSVPFYMKPKLINKN